MAVSRIEQQDGPLVTIAIPTYNRADGVGRAIESALAQTFPDFELLVLDDGSSDHTKAVVSAYQDSRLHYARNPSNIGMTGNWNRGFELARGRYVSLLHDDDRWFPQFLERALNVFHTCPDAGFVYAASGILYGLEREDRVFSSRAALDRLRRRNEVAEEAVLVRRAALLEVGGFQDRWPYSMDWEAWLKIAARHPVGYLAEELASKGTDEGRLSDRLDRDALVLAKDCLGMLMETIPELPLPEDECHRLLVAARRSLAQAQMVTALDWAARGDGARARTEANFAFRIDPGVLLGSPPLVTCAYLGSWLPAPLLRRMNRFRETARRVLRRD